ncbi:MAG: site-2 protease family protein [Oscillospiraceae bacterium]|jgi:regulator of sigma E protease|nr:site-2 protease family protein [Oscillospiraceae bacterium]
MSIVIALLVFGVIIFIHELGHCVAAKKSGILVHEFAIGMGWKVLSFSVNKMYYPEKPQKKITVKREKNHFTITTHHITKKDKKSTEGETVYSWRLVPFGGFCAMEGENEDSNNPRAFGNKPVGKRMIVIVAGAFMNLLLGLVLLFVITAEFDEYLLTNKINSFKTNAESAQQLQIGDEILKIDGTTIFTSDDIIYQMQIANTNTFDVTVRRNGEKIKLKDVTFDTWANYYKDPEKGDVEITAENPAPEGANVEKISSGPFDFTVEREEKTPAKVLGYTFRAEATYIQLIFTSLKALIVGDVELKEMSGPVGIVSTVSQAVDESAKTREAVYSTLFLTMLITINVGIFNLLPIPALDGGRFVFLLIEAFRRKKVPQNIEATIHGVAFMLLMAFILVVSINDVSNLFNNLNG